MKLSRLIFTTILIFIFAACAKDELLDQSKNLPELKKAKVAILLKGEFKAVPDTESSLILIPIPDLDPNDPANYDHARMIVSGNCTHLGKIDSKKSFYVIDTYEMILEEEVPFLMQTGTGQLVAANGDSFEFTWWAKASLPTLDYIGGIEIMSGTGRFKGCSGVSAMTGKFDEANKTNRWTTSGTIEFN
jgi:hypothetical protein